MNRSLKITLFTLFTVAALSLGSLYKWQATRTNLTIKVGILHSLTGTMAISEIAVVNATLMAIEEINAAGGILGRQIKPIIIDGKSDPASFASGATDLLTQHKVAVVFGCWTSASRKTVKPIFERHNRLLFYPVQYEGLEQSSHIVYTGSAPNQQILPAVTWCFRHLHAKSFFLVGSDYVFPRTANELIKAQVRALGGEITDEQYLPLGSTKVDSIVSRIVETKPDVILNTINGDSNIAFFNSLRDAAVTAQNSPVMSFSIAEVELANMDTSYLAGHYATWSYFQSVKSPVNDRFVAAYKKRFGENKVTSDPIEAPP